MTTVQHERPALEPRRRLPELLVREVAASLAIAVMWLAVPFTAVFGPDIVSTSSSGTTSVPSGVVVALFASLASAAVARHAFDRERRR